MRTTIFSSLASPKFKNCRNVKNYLQTFTLPVPNHKMAEKRIHRTPSNAVPAHLTITHFTFLTTYFLRIIYEAFVCLTYTLVTNVLLLHPEQKETVHIM